MMPDNLRDRIAAVSRCCRWHKPNAPCDDFGCNNPPTDWDYELADAVIAALDLQPLQRSTMFPERRWVTPWELIDEPEMRDSDTCSMGPSMEPCEHGTRSSRYCKECN